MPRIEYEDFANPTGAQEFGDGLNTRLGGLKTASNEAFCNQEEYDEEYSYYKNDVANDGAGVLWYSLQDGNTGNALAVGAWWAKLGGEVGSFDINALTLDETLNDADAEPRYDSSSTALRKNTLGAKANYVIAKLLAAARNFTSNVNISGTLGIGTTSPNASAAVQINSTTQGFAGPRMTTTQRDAIGSPLTGLEIYNTTVGEKQVYGGAAWAAVGPAGSGEINTTSNSGGGEGLALAKSGVDLPFKSLVAGTGIDVSSSPTEVTIAFDGTIGTNDTYDMNRLGSNPSAPSAGIMRLFSVAASSFLFWKDSGGTVRSAALAGAATASGLTQATNKLLGRSTASTGAVEEIAIGAGLSLSGGTLSATGGGDPADAYDLTATSDVFSFDAETNGDLFNIIVATNSSLDFDKTKAKYDGQVVQFRVAATSVCNLTFTGDYTMTASNAENPVALVIGDYDILCQFDARGTDTWWVKWTELVLAGS